METTHAPQTLVEAIRYFADPDVSLQTMIELRWPEGVHCPICGRTDVRFIATRRLWECKEKHPKRQFSAKVGTIFEDSPLSLEKWFSAIWMIANCKNGVSSYELHRAIGVTQKSAWFMLHRIRLAMQTGSFVKMSGSVEADETLVGGLARDMHKGRREKIIKGGTGAVGKAVVMGILERKGARKTSPIRTRVVKDARQETLQKVIRETVAPGANLFTDGHCGHTALTKISARRD